jgi:hypothetical protein
MAPSHIAQRLHLPANLVRDILTQAGVPPPNWHAPKDVGWTDEQLAALYAAGYSATAIGREVGLGVRAVLRRLHSQGVTIRPCTSRHSPRKVTSVDRCACCGILLKFSGDGLHKAGSVDGMCLDCAERWVQDGESWRRREDYVLDLAPVRVGCDVRVALWAGWRMVEEE